MAEPFSTGGDARLEGRGEAVVNVVRVAFGLLLCHRQLDMAGFAILAPEPERFTLRCLAEAGLAAAVALGMLTPLALAALLVLLTIAPTAASLGVQVARIVCWGLLLAGAGRSWSMDSRVGVTAFPRTAAAVGTLYHFAAPKGRLGFVRLLLVALYWALGVSGVSFHVSDPFWLRGEVLQVALGLPYMSEHYPFFTTFLNRQPALYDLGCRAALYVQAFWQLGLLPLFFLPCLIARGFAILQGAAFFLASTLLFNLGYLGPLELCLWVLVFGSLPRGGLGYGSAPEPPPRRPLTGLVGVGLLAAATSVVLSLAIAIPGLARVELLRRAAARPLRIFGLEPVNVFNRADLGMGTIYFVLLETDDKDRPLRVVPFIDRYGGRLDYLRNDYLYFSLSLPWQRAGRNVRFVGGSLEQPSQRTLELFRDLLDLDVCLTRLQTPRHYRAEIITRALVEGDRFGIWSEPQLSTTIRLAVGPARVAGALTRLEGAARVLGCYDLPPGHVGSGRRGADTLAWARRIHSH